MIQKKPQSAYFMFLASFRPQYFAANPGSKGIKGIKGAWTMSKAAGVAWAKMSDTARAPYHAQHDEAVGKYKKATKAAATRRHRSSGPEAIRSSSPQDDGAEEVANGRSKRLVKSRTTMCHVANVGFVPVLHENNYQIGDTMVPDSQATFAPRAQLAAPEPPRKPAAPKPKRQIAAHETARMARNAAIRADKEAATVSRTAVLQTGLIVNIHRGRSSVRLSSQGIVMFLCRLGQPCRDQVPN